MCDEKKQVAFRGTILYHPLKPEALDAMQYKAIKLEKRPEIHITPDLFETVTLEAPELDDGEFLLKQTHMSLDPAMKGWMTDDRKSYIPPVELGEAPITSSRNDWLKDVGFGLRLGRQDLAWDE